MGTGETNQDGMNLFILALGLGITYRPLVVSVVSEIST